MEHFIDFIQNYGYIAVFLGSLIEGESVILIASVLAHQGYLSLTKIMITAFIGTLFADQALYFVGRYYGPSLFERYPRFKKPAKKAFRLLHHWDSWFILSFRFIYGIRIISPIVAGASGLSPKRFIPLNFIAAFIWTVVSCVGGYMLAETVEELFENFHTIQQYSLYFLIGFVSLVVVGLCVARKRDKL